MKYLFFIGMGRAGTKFLSSLLSIDQNITVCHEFIGNREYWLLSWYLGEDYSTHYLEKSKLEISKTANKKQFIDVNSYLANSVNSLDVVFDKPNIFHLVRH